MEFLLKDNRKKKERHIPNQIGGSAASLLSPKN